MDGMYFTVYFDPRGVLHIAPRNPLERMALKHFEYEVGEHGLEKMISIDTELATALPPA